MLSVILGILISLYVFYIFYNNRSNIRAVYSIVKTNENTLLLYVLLKTLYILLSLKVKQCVKSYIITPKNLLLNKVSDVVEKSGLTNYSIKLEGNKYDITLNIKGKIYKLFIKKISPPDIIQIVDEGEEDVTDEISPYILTSQCIISELTPQHFGKKSLHFTNEEITFDNYDPITI